MQTEMLQGLYDSKSIKSLHANILQIIDFYLILHFALI